MQVKLCDPCLSGYVYLLPIHLVSLLCLRTTTRINRMDRGYNGADSQSVCIYIKKLRPHTTRPFTRLHYIAIQRPPAFRDRYCHSAQSSSSHQNTDPSPYRLQSPETWRTGVSTSVVPFLYIRGGSIYRKYRGISPISILSVL